MTQRDICDCDCFCSFGDKVKKVRQFGRLVIMILFEKNIGQKIYIYYVVNTKINLIAAIYIQLDPPLQNYENNSLKQWNRKLFSDVLDYFSEVHKLKLLYLKIYLTSNNLVRKW